MNDCNLTLGERIADTLLKQGKTQTDLCNEIGMKTSTLNAIITGERKNPRIETIVPIAKGLNTSLDYLLGLSDEPSTDVELKAIYNKYGVSPKALQNIKKISRNISESSDDYISLSRLTAINYLLENENLAQFSDTLYGYFTYFPARNIKTFLTIYDDGKDDYTDKVDFTICLDERDLRGIKPEFMNEVMLNDLKNDIKNIKSDSTQILKSLKNELKKLNENHGKLIDKGKKGLISDDIYKRISEEYYKDIEDTEYYINAIERGLRQLK